MWTLEGDSCICAQPGGLLVQCGSGVLRNECDGQVRLSEKKEEEEKRHRPGATDLRGDSHDTLPACVRSCLCTFVRLLAIDLFCAIFSHPDPGRALLL